MWIIPSTISASAPDTVASISDSSEFCQLAEQSLTWRSKPSPSRTWSRRWKRESWLRLLSGRTCTPSHSTSFSEWWISSLRASRVSPSVKRASAKASKTSDTCGPGSPRASDDPDQLLFSWKTSTESPPLSRPDSSRFSTMSSAIWRAWVTDRRQDSTRRMKSAHRTSESGGSYSEWPTATTMMSKSRARYTKGTMHAGRNLIDTVLGWPTPTTDSATHRTGRYAQGGVPLTAAVSAAQNWPTPDASIEKFRLGGSSQQSKSLEAMARRGELGLPDQDRTSTRGKSQGQLNPGWVEQLMGLPVGWTQLSIEWIASDSSETA